MKFSLQRYNFLPFYLAIIKKSLSLQLPLLLLNHEFYLWKKSRRTINPAR